MKGRGSKFAAVSIITLLVILAARCGADKNDTVAMAEQQPRYLNHHDTVGYVGIETCRSCHSNIHQTFVHTGMGSSFGVADTQKSIATIDGESVLYDPHLNLNYQPYWQGDTLWLKEFRLNTDGDTVYRNVKKINYVVGSGQHTNSHIIEDNGYLFQAPFTWYSQKGKLDLPPGFEGGQNSRFSRKIGLECTSCHNAMPTGFVKGSINRYAEVPKAIDCERCHGPGELHVKRVSEGKLVDTAEAIDYSIVNVAKLEPQLQFEVCQRCHLQGNTVLKPGKSFFDFKPGMKLKEVMEIYLPRYSNSEDDFIMASHVDRFKQSACVQQSNQQFNCVSCHNPHVSVAKTKIEKFNATCQNCHRGEPTFDCTEELAVLQAKNFNCVKCHMPSSSSTDIPHVTVHDHKIKVPSQVVDTSGIKKFLELVAVNNPNPDPRSKAVAYIQQFEKFEAKPYYLDSATYFLNKVQEQEQLLNEWIHLYFLKGDYASIQNLVEKIGEEVVLETLTEQSYVNRHAWTAYRISESFVENSNYSRGLKFIKRAVELMPYDPDVRFKLASAYQNNSMLTKAKEEYKKVLHQKEDHARSLNNLGFIALQEGNANQAEIFLKKALAAEPDYELAWLNLANAQMIQGNDSKALQALEEALRINPANQRAKRVLSILKKES